MSRGRRDGLVLCLLLSLGVPAHGVAQICTAPGANGTCTVATSTTLTIGRVVELTLSSVSTTLTAPAVADYDAGFVADAGPTATVRSNGPWRLQISGTAATWTAANTEPGVSARTTKPVGDLTWSTAGGGPFAALSLTPVDASVAGATAGNVVNLFYRTVYSWGLDTPGAYSLTVVFTIVAP